MRSIFKTMLILPFLFAGTHSANSASVDPSETYGYWGEEISGGGSSCLGRPAVHSGGLRSRDSEARTRRIPVPGSVARSHVVDAM